MCQGPRFCWPWSVRLSSKPCQPQMRWTQARQHAQSPRPCPFRTVILTFWPGYSSKPLSWWHQVSGPVCDLGSDPGAGAKTVCCARTHMSRVPPALACPCTSTHAFRPSPSPTLSQHLPGLQIPALGPSHAQRPGPPAAPCDTCRHGYLLSARLPCICASSWRESRRCAA